MPEAISSERQVLSLIQRWVDAVCRGDMEGVLANHSPGIVMYDVPEPVQCKGLGAYRKTWELFFSANAQGPDCFRLSELVIHMVQRVDEVLALVLEYAPPKPSAAAAAPAAAPAMT